MSAWVCLLWASCLSVFTHTLRSIWNAYRRKRPPLRIVKDDGSDLALQTALRNRAEELLAAAKDELTNTQDELAKVLHQRDDLVRNLLAFNLCREVPKRCTLERPCPACVKALHDAISGAQGMARA